MKYLLTIVIALLINHVSVAQPPKDNPPKHPPIEKRWEMDRNKMKDAGLEKDLARMKPAFMDFYKTMDALVKKNKGERPPKEQAEKVMQQRRAALKKVLTAEKFRAFISVEKTLGPKRREGPPPVQ